jgi:hypothetical protein
VLIGQTPVVESHASHQISDLLKSSFLWAFRKRKSLQLLQIGPACGWFNGDQVKVESSFCERKEAKKPRFAAGF